MKLFIWNFSTKYNLHSLELVWSYTTEFRINCPFDAKVDVLTLQQLDIFG